MKRERKAIEFRQLRNHCDGAERSSITKDWFCLLSENTLGDCNTKNCPIWSRWPTATSWEKKDTDWKKELVELVQAGCPVEAVRRYRELTGATIKEAIIFVRGLKNKRNHSSS